MENSQYVKAGNGMLFNNDKKQPGIKQPDYTGPITIIEKDGSERKLRMSAWKRDNNQVGIELQFKKEDAAQDEAPF